MSPASSGTLEIERYIGACLISSPQQGNKRLLAYPNAAERHPQRFVPEVYHQHHQRSYGAQPRWAGGVPLISFSNQRRRQHQEVAEERHTPLARLAVHTQGAPLILAQRFGHRKNKSAFKNVKTNEARAKNEQKPADAVSVASDESSGSANSENCLPRIIKPRKRRKKDRKPPHLSHPLNQDGSGFSTDSASPDILDSPSPSLGSFAPFSCEYKGSCSDAGYYNETAEAPRLHHSFEDVQEAEDAPVQASVCQCRICDPSGFIWNVDRDCYSPFLTAPKASLEHQVQDLGARLASVVSLDGTTRQFCGSGDLEVSTEIVTSPNGHRDLEIRFFSSTSSEKVDKCSELNNNGS